ncbi:MAG: thiamine diphosphokinase [Rhodobacteraceae bacterium]|nr:thiamine diphosphokinase [Paracoccaceae bacterium]
MKKPIVEMDLGITVLAGGRAKRRQIARAMRHAPVLVAADKGALTALKHGLMPTAVIGDMDSSDDLTHRIPAERLHRIAEQDSTDFQKCLYSIRAPFAIALGLTGSRLDHSLAGLSTLAAWQAMPVLALAGKDVVFAPRAPLTLALPVGTRVSLFALAEMRGTASGLEWPIEAVRFGPMGELGTSNRASRPEIRLEFSAPGMLVILPARHIGAVLEGLGLNRSAR